MTLAFLAVTLWLAIAQSPSTPAAPVSPDEEALRAAVQQYYDAQSARDADRAVAFWSAAADPRPGRDAYLAVFGEPAEDRFQVAIGSVEIAGAEARLRVSALRTRLTMKDGQPNTQRTALLESQVWRKESGGWKLLRDGPFAEAIADDLIAAAPADRPARYEKISRPDLVQARLAISQRATMAITLQRNYLRGRELFGIALDVARASGDRHGEANSLHNIAQAAYFLHDYAAATDGYRQELEVARAIDDQLTAAAALFGLASVAYSQADYIPALGLYRDALAIYEKNEDASSIGRTLVSIGNIQYLQADYDAALASYRRGLASLVEGGDPAGASYARRGLARVLGAQGDVAAALAIYGQVLADARAALAADARLTPDVASALEGIAELYFRVGNTDQARASLEEAGRLDDKDPEGAGRVLAALGMTELVAGRFDAALAAYTGSRTRFETVKMPDGIARAWVGIGFSQSARERFADAIAAYRSAIALFEQQNNNDGVGRAWLGLSMAQSGAGDHAAALDSAGKVAAIAEGLKSEDLAWRGSVRAGEALRKLGRLEEAVQAFTRATTVLDRLAADAPTNTEARAELNDSASAWTGLAFSRAAQGDAAGALAAMEGRRAHLRRVCLAPFEHDVAPGASAAELADEQAIARDIISARVKLRAQSQAPRHDAARLEQLDRQLSELVAKRTDQQGTLYGRLPDLPRWRGLPQPPLSASAIADLVPGDGGVLVAYLLNDDELLAVTVARAEHGADVEAVTAPFDRRGVADALAAAMQPDVLEDAAEWRRHAAPLAAALIDPIAPRLAGRDRLVFVPDDLLWKVPFEALSGVPASATVTYATSLATLALERQAPPLPEHRTAAIVAAPAIPDTVRAQMTLMLPSWRAPDAAASLAAAEADARAYSEGVPVRAAADASESAVRALVGSADVLHAQAPLQVSATAPLLSSVLLAATGDAPEEDGRLEVREWFRLAGRARVVVLSDGSAFGAAGVGNAMDAMAWAAAAAGASTMVIGRWPADGFTADAVAAAFHAKLAGGLSPIQAWRAAIAAARVANAPPSLWAGLRLVGGGN
ncbi:MAG TPA: CHAT domain-containing protein [Vicinamibacterales bacterium]|jgi:tetratricopeptide (TPR) repeat protein